MTESLTTDLSRISGTFVIGRSTAFTYKGKTVDLKSVGRELGVRYVLEGSVQRGGDRMRVNVQLIEAETGAHLWAERFDKPVADLFEMQDEIVARLANQLRAELVHAEARRAERALNPDSMDLYFQGQALSYRGELRTSWRESVYSLNARSNWIPATSRRSPASQWWIHCRRSLAVDDPRPFMAAAEAKFSKALSAAPNHAGAHFGLGFVLSLTGRAQRGIDELERALAIDPNMAIARATLGLAQIFVGRAENTDAHVLEALRLSPRDPYVALWFQQAGLAKLFLGDFAQALPWNKKSIDANRNNPCFFRSRRLSRAFGPVGRGAKGGEGRPCRQPEIHHCALPRRLSERQRRVSRSARTYDRRHANGRGPGRMSLAASPRSLQSTVADLLRSGGEGYLVPHDGMTAMAQAPVLPKATPVGAVSAQLSRPRS